MTIRFQNSKHFERDIHTSVGSVWMNGLRYIGFNNVKPAKNQQRLPIYNFLCLSFLLVL